MFRLLLKLLGLEQYEYPENSGIVKNNNPSSSITSQAKVQQKVTVESEPKQQVEVKSEPKQKVKVKPESKQENPEVKAEPVSAAEILVEKYSGLKSNYAKMLIEAGYDSLAKIEQASDKELLAIKGIGKATVKLLRE